MPKYLKHTLLVLILLVGYFILSNEVSEDSSPQEVKELPTEKKTKEFVITTYPKEQTAKVSHKLDSVFKRFNKRNDFNGSVLIAKKGKVLFSNEYGYANFESKTKLGEKSVFQLASVSKQFTAAGIMILKERNLLQLNDSVIKYYPEFPYKDVTIKHLLNHTAGLPNYFWIAEHKWEKEKAPSNKEMMDLLAKQKTNRFFKSGRNFNYSNTGYFVLASLIEKISGTSYSEFLKTNIFEPLQMKDSFVYSFKNDSLKPNQLAGYRLYRWRHHVEVKGTVNDAVVGDKNVYSTTEDLFKWITGLNSGNLISKESLEMMYSKGETKYGRKVPYGFGFRIDTRKNKNTIYHHGKWNGFSTSITQYKDTDLLVIALEHSSYRSMTHLNKTVEKIVSKHFKPDVSNVAALVKTKNSSESL
ncbi:MAG: beta-lactamase family protein [Flavobacteriaceae bacterium]|nr:beta-lactamase family protein [Flavobacteriaceae bacterium]